MTVLHHSTETGIAYRDEGRGTPILLIHGWGVSGELFNAQIEDLSGSFRVIVPDLPGHGASRAFPHNAPFSKLADSLAELLSELGLEKVCILGWSMGAMIAWDLLRRHPKADVAGLVVVDMVPRLVNEPEWHHGLRDGGDAWLFERNIAAMLDDWPAYTDLFVPRIFSSCPEAGTEAWVAKTKKVALANDPQSLAAIWARLEAQDFRSDLPDIEIPVLVVAGSHSQLYSVAASEWVAAQMPKARFELLTRSGHAPHVEEPGRFNHLLSEFVDSLFANPKQATYKPAQSGIEPN